MVPQLLETECEWLPRHFASQDDWVEHLTAEEIAEIDAAICTCSSKLTVVSTIDRSDFPLTALARRLKAIERELVGGRGFVVIRGLPTERYTHEQVCLAYWGIATYLGQARPQNHHSHLLGNVTDQGKTFRDSSARGNELGQVGLEFHCDRSDIVGLLCLQTSETGGLSKLCSSVSLHNDLVRERPDLAAELYMAQPYDMHDEQPAGQVGWAEIPVFTQAAERLFVFFNYAYIHSSQRMEKAPRLTAQAAEALTWLRRHAESSRYSITMAFQPGDIQFLNNYHVLHGRTPYRDNYITGKVRHLKRLWLQSEAFSHRPQYLLDLIPAHWEILG